MNRQRVLIAAITGFAAFAFAAQAQVSPIRIDVDPRISTKASTGKTSSTSNSKTRQEYLDITLQNVTSQAFSGLTLRYAIFADDVATDAVSVAGRGEQPVDLKPLSPWKFETPPVTVTRTDIAKRRTSSQNTSSGTAKPKTPAGPTGKKLGGYGVQVMQGSTVLAEYFSDPALKSKMDMVPAGKAKAAPKKSTQPAKPKKPTSN